MKLFKSIFTVFIAISLILCTFTTSVYAEETNSGIILTGNYSDNLTFVVDNDMFFDKKMAAPGDAWGTSITIKNISDDKEIEISLESIKNEIEETKLFDELNLNISIGDDIIYNGSYSTKQTPIIPWLTIEPNSSKYLYIVVSVPSSTNNTIQGVKMLSSWNFDCRVNEPSKTYEGIPSTISETLVPEITQESNNPIKTGVQYLYNHPVVIIAFVSSLLAITMIIIYIIFKKKK